MLPKKSLAALISLITCLPLKADLLSDAMELPTVLSATRLKQSPAEVPGSMTILDRQLIRASGARDIPEVLRLVPGMKVGYRSGHQVNVNYHGTNFNEARRMQVLVDGRSVYRPGLAAVDWNDIPLAIEDIERIEVFRGPNTATFGANALMGVINIISTQPELSQGSRIKITRGRRGVDDFYARHGFAFGRSHARLSLFGKQDDGFELTDDDDPYRDSRRLNAFNLNGNTQLSASQSLSWQLGAKEGSKQRENDYSEMAEASDDSFLFDRMMEDQLASDSDIAAKDYFVQLHWKNEVSPNHQLEIKTYAQHMERLTRTRACDSPIVFSPEMRELYQVGNVYPRRMNYILRNRSGIWGDPDFYRDFLVNWDGLPAEYLPLIENIIDQHAAIRNGPPTCFNLNENLRETRYEIELQNTLQVTPALRSVFGLNLRHDQASSDTLFGGRVHNTIGQLFGSLEYRLSERWMLHAGAMAEEDQLSGFSLTPRLAAHFFIAPTHSLRAVYSEAVRSPDMYENNAYWTYSPDKLTGAPTTGDTYYALAQGPGNLEQEHMRSAELGYNGHFYQAGLSVDIKLYYDEIDNMISQPLQVVNFVPDNSSFARFKGGETQLDWQASRNHRLRATYAYVDFTATNRLDQRLTSRHSGSLGWLANWSNQLETSLFYYGAQRLNEYRFERLDARIARRFQINQHSDLELALVWQRRLDDEPLTRDENLFKQRNYFHLSAEFNF